MLSAESRKDKDFGYFGLSKIVSRQRIPAKFAQIPLDTGILGYRNTGILVTGLLVTCILVSPQKAQVLLKIEDDK